MIFLISMGHQMNSIFSTMLLTSMIKHLYLMTLFQRENILIYTLKFCCRWELSAVETLPAYMQACYTSLYNITNEIAEAIFKGQGWNPVNSLKKSVRIFIKQLNLQPFIFNLFKCLTYNISSFLLNSGQDYAMHFSQNQDGSDPSIFRMLMNT